MVDPLPLLRTTAGGSPVFRSADDYHWTPRAHQLVAHLLHKYLTTERLIVVPNESSYRARPPQAMTSKAPPTSTGPGDCTPPRRHEAQVSPKTRRRPIPSVGEARIRPGATRIATQRKLRPLRAMVETTRRSAAGPAEARREPEAARRRALTSRQRSPNARDPREHRSPRADEPASPPRAASPVGRAATRRRASGSGRRGRRGPDPPGRSPPGSRRRY